MENHNGVVKTKQQMADEYGVCRKTFNKSLQNRLIKLDRGLISPKEQFILYNELGNIVLNLDADNYGKEN